MKLDFHIHSKFSDDSLSEPSRIVSAALRKGLDGIAITDHGEFNAVSEARKAAKKIAPSFLVIGGQEVLCEFGDLLCLFISRRVESLDFDSVAKEVHGQGGIIALPHAFDSMRKSSFKTKKLSPGQIRSIDAVEAFNGRCVDDASNIAAADFALKYSKPVIAGSDAHFCFEIGSAYTLVDGSSEKEAKRNILAGKTSVQGEQSRLRPWFAHFLTRSLKPVRKFFK